MQVAPLPVIQAFILDVLNTYDDPEEHLKRKVSKHMAFTTAFYTLVTLCWVIQLEIGFTSPEDFFKKLKAIASRWEMESEQ